MKSRTIAIVAAVAAGMLASAAQAEVFVYPKPGQSQDAFQKDQYECHNWAKQQTGFDPGQPSQAAAAPPPQQGGAVRGAARGAAVGAVGGAIAGDAGKGAAVGAAVGGTGGAMRQNRNNREAAQASQQAQAQQQAAYGNYEKAYATCLSGRGYSVK
jgi:outer membrane protein with glycine zipper